VGWRRTSACVIYVLAVGRSLVRELSAPEGPAISSDGASVYGSAFKSDAVDVINRNVDSGALIQKSHRAGCALQTQEIEPRIGRHTSCVLGAHRHSPGTHPPRSWTFDRGASRSASAGATGAGSERSIGDLGGAEEAREVAQGVGQAAKQLVAGRHMHMLGVVTPSWLWDHLRVGRIVSARADCSMLSRLRRSAARPPSTPAAPGSSLPGWRTFTHYAVGSGGGSVADASGHGRTGTATGGVTLGQTGLLRADPNTAASFDGSSGVIVQDSCSSSLRGLVSTVRATLPCR
jgi:hypothetical protein